MVSIMRKGIGGHSLPNKGATDEWLTPPWILKGLGKFDLDPCSPVNRPWDTAGKHFTIKDNGLAMGWDGLVFLNPPYAEVERWMERLSFHGNGIALIFARTDTIWFHQMVFQRATSILFLKGRLFFHFPDGTQAKHNSGGPSALVAYGHLASSRLLASKFSGSLCYLNV